MDMKKIGPNAIEMSVANRILDLLTTDDAYRELFVKDVHTALAQAGYAPAPGEAHAGWCLQTGSLASKEDIARDRAKLEKTLNSIQGFMVPRELSGAG